MWGIIKNLKDDSHATRFFSPNKFHHHLLNNIIEYLFYNEKKSQLGKHNKCTKKYMNSNFTNLLLTHFLL